MTARRALNPTLITQTTTPVMGYERTFIEPADAKTVASAAQISTVPVATIVPKPNTGLHGAVVKLLAGINVFILGAFWWTLRGDSEAVFMVAISAAYLLAYMGTPWMMGRVGGQHLDESVPLNRFLREPFEMWTGVITGREAMIQVLMVPVAIALAVVGMCAIITAHQ